MSVTSYEFPKKIEERMNSVLSTINTEWKSIMWSLMNDRWMTSNDLRMEYEKGTGKLVSHVALKNYNDYTLIPVGLVAKKYVRKQGYGLVDVYSLKGEGLLLQPIADFSIKTAVDNGISMYEIFGATQSINRKQRNPLTTYQILRELNENENLRKTDFVEKYGFSESSFLTSIRRLSEIGFVKYDSVNSENIKGKFLYVPVENKTLEHVKKIGHHSLEKLRSAAEIAIEKGHIDIDMVEEKFNVAHRTAIDVIYELRKQGILKPEKYQNRVKLSETNVTSKGRNFLERFLVPIEESLRTEKIKIPDVVLAATEKVDFNYRHRAHDLYESFSRKNNKDVEHRMDEVRKVLKHGPIRVGELLKRIGVNYRSFIKRMENKGEIRREKKGKAVFVVLLK